MRTEERGGAGTASRGRRRLTVRRLAVWAGCLLLGAVIAGELGARWIVGLGDPPLFVLDPEIEYYLKPDQRCRRFGHDYVVNSHSMRSREFAARKPAAKAGESGGGTGGEFRVMVIGDSVVNGGGKIDQQELATELLRRTLSEQMKRDVVVGNMSAPSWGPPNELAFAKKFGLFDADVVVIVSNSDDADDVPGVEYIGSAWPREKPWCALQELVGVYGWKALCKAAGRPAEPPPPAHTTTHEQDVERCRAAFGELVGLARGNGARVALVQWLKRSELGGTRQSGFGTIAGWAKERDVPVQVGEGVAADAYQPGDDIHPNAAGEEALAGLLRRAVEGAK